MPSFLRKTKTANVTGAAARTRTTIKTFGPAQRERAPLVFVETSRGSRPDEAFFLICGSSLGAQELYRTAIAEFRRGIGIRPPEEYMDFLRQTALALEGGSLEQRVSFAAGWVRAGTCCWTTGGTYLIAQLSREGNVLRLPGDSGRASIAHMDRLVAAERANFDEVEQSFRQRTDRGDLEATLRRMSQERKLGGALVVEHEVLSGQAGRGPAPETTSGAGRTEPAAGVGTRLRVTWIFGFAAVVVAAVLILKWPFAEAPPRDRTQEISDPREVSAVALDRPADDETEQAGYSKVTISEKWTKKFKAAVTSSPRVAGGKVYFGCRDGGVYCLDAATGRELWKRNTGSGVGASPALHEGRVYVGSYDGTFWCMDSSNGRVIWRFKSAGKIVSSASVASGCVVFGSYDRNVYCLSTEDGSLKWRLATGGLVWSSPLVQSGRCYFGSADGIFYCVLLGSGDVKWKYSARSPIYASAGGATPFVCSGSNSGGVFILDAQNGKELFRTETRREVRSAVLVQGQSAYVGADDGVIRRIRLSDGTAVWSFKTGGAIRSEPALSNGLLFVTSYDGKLHVIDAFTGSEMAAFDARSQIYSSPAVTDDQAYFGTNGGDFICLNVVREPT
jgi:outer membrane protein assembly factor BamB